VNFFPLPDQIEPPQNASPGELIAFVMEGLSKIHDDEGAAFFWKPALAQVLRRKLPFTPEQVLQMVKSTAVSKRDFPYRGILKAVEQTPMTPQLAEALRQMRAHVDEFIGGPEMRAVHERIDALLSAGEPPASDPRPVFGPWSAAVVPGLDGELLSLALALKQSEPPAKWRQRAAEVAARIGHERLRDQAVEWLALGPTPGAAGVLMDGKESEFVKGVLWLLPPVADARLTRELARFAEACLKKIPGLGAVSQKAGNACVNVLAAIGTEDAVAQLSRLVRRVRYDTALRLIEEALEQAAARAGLSRDELEERTVPNVDLSADSPKARKERAALLSSHIMRVERLMLTQRAIPYLWWRECYLDQPLLSDTARRLIWQFEADGNVWLGIWWDGRMVDETGSEIAVPSTAIVRLWHPILSAGCAADASGETARSALDPIPLPRGVATVLYWRCWLEDHAVRQPFKQAHREVYLVTPAERESQDHSLRFAKHVLRQHQFQALCEGRGWKFRLLGAFDSHNNPTLSLPGGLSATLEVDFPKADRLSPHAIHLYIETGAVRFRKEGVPCDLASVPPVVFSEVMRDVDLFVGVASVGNVPEMGLEDGPFRDYWQRFAFESSGAAVESRRDVLQRLLPRLSIASRCMLDGRFLAVQGDRALYRIHLGSGNVLMEPGSRYLCIVPGSSTRSGTVDAGQVALPFEGDEQLALILSKAFLLANDKSIRDPAILRQLPSS
jgi:hypothetical protein